MTDIRHEHRADERHSITANEARAGTPGPQVSYVMIASTLGAAIAMAIVLIYLWSTWG